MFWPNPTIKVHLPEPILRIDLQEKIVLQKLYTVYSYFKYMKYTIIFKDYLYPILVNLPFSDSNVVCISLGNKSIPIANIS